LLLDKILKVLDQR
jgi:thiamine kinase-like enzyme